VVAGVQVESGSPAQDSSSAHARLQREARPVDHELAVTAVMNGLRLLLRRIDPGLQHFEDEQIIVFDEAPVGYLAFQVGETFGDERRLDARGRQPGQAVLFKFVDRAAGRIADLHHFARQSARRNAITHSPVALSAAKLKLLPLTTHATRGGSNSIIMCQDMVMTLACPLRDVASSTTGPGSSNW
jgi:hypothetical protein